MRIVIIFIHFIISIVFLLFPAAFQSVFAQTATKPEEVQFKWSFIVRIDTAGRNEIVNIAKNIVTKKTNKVSVSAGDEIAMYIEPGENTYVYLFLLDSSNNLELLFPISLDMENLEDEFTRGKGTYIPGKYEWFSFDEKKGYESFYLLASPKRFTKLEELTKNYIETEEEKDLAKQKVLDEIKGIKRTAAFKTVLERPIAFGGRIRSLEIDIADLAVEVKANNFYSKTIRVKHE